MAHAGKMCSDKNSTTSIISRSSDTVEIMLVVLHEIKWAYAL